MVSRATLSSSGIFNFLHLLNKAISYSTHITEHLLHEMLFLLYRQAQACFPNYSQVIQWMKLNLSLIVHLNDAILLIKYLKLFLPLPSESLNQIDYFRQFVQANPLQLHTFLSSPISKKKWCEKMDIVISERTVAINNEKFFLFKRVYSFLRVSITCCNSKNQIYPFPLEEVSTTKSVRSPKVVNPE